LFEFGILDGVDDCVIERIGDVRNHDPDHVSVLCPHAASVDVGLLPNSAACIRA
jgi:hypothetical protein